MTQTIAIAADHGGFELKAALKAAFPDITWHDYGTNSADSVDYPDFANALAAGMKNGEAAIGILICGSGIGMSIAANRHHHLRAALAHDVTTARLSRLHNDANVLCLGARITGLEVAKDCVTAFLTTAFEGGRHQKRVDKLG